VCRMQKKTTINYHLHRNPLIFFNCLQYYYCRHLPQNIVLELLKIWSSDVKRSMRDYFEKNCISVNLIKIMNFSKIILYSENPWFLIVKMITLFPGITIGKKCCAYKVLRHEYESGEQYLYELGIQKIKLNYNNFKKKNITG